MKHFAVLMAVCIPFMAPAHAAEVAQRPATPATPPPSQVRDLIGCRNVSEPTARLACYDSHAGALANAIESRDVVVVDREQVRNTRRSLFGFSLPNFNLFGHSNGDDPEEEIREITGTVASAQRVNYAWVVTLADGSRWRQTDDTVLALSPRAGMPARVERAALGSYRMILARMPGMKVRREGE